MSYLPSPVLPHPQIKIKKLQSAWEKEGYEQWEQRLCSAQVSLTGDMIAYLTPHNISLSIYTQLASKASVAHGH